MSYNPFPPVNAAAGAAVPAQALWVAGTDGTDLRGVLVDTSGREIVVGAAASGAAVAGNPILVAGSDGTDARSLTTDSSGRLITVQYRSDGRAYPLGAKLASGNVTTTGGGASFLATPGAGNHILILGISIGVNVASGNFVQLEATIGGATNVFITVLGGNSQGMVIPGGLLLDANTGITGIAGASAGGAAALTYDVVT